MAVATKKKPSKPAAIALPEIKPPTSAPEKGKNIEVQISALVFDTYHDRVEETHDAQKIHELAVSMNESGLLMPIGVCEVPADNGVARFRLIHGRRRVEAAKLLKWTQIRAICFQSSDDSFVLRMREIENLHRLDLNPAEVAAAVCNLLDFASFEAAAVAGGHGSMTPVELREAARVWPPGDIRTLAQKLLENVAIKAAAVQIVAAAVAKPAQWVRDHAFLSKLNGEDREMVLSGKIPFAYARELAKVADPARRDELVKLLKEDLEGDDRLRSLEDFRREVGRNLYSLAQVPWRLDQAFAGAPACVECPHNSANAPGLFEAHTEFVKDEKESNKLKNSWMGDCSGKAEPGAGVCTKHSCFIMKTSTTNQAVSKAATKLKHQVIKTQDEKPANRVAASEKNAAAVAAPFVKPEVVSQRVAQRLKEAKEKKKVPLSRKGLHRNAVPYYETPEYKGNQEWQRACKDYAKSLAPKIIQEIGKKPGALLLLHAVLQTSFAKGTRSNQEKTVKKHLDAPEFQQILKGLLKPDWDLVLKIQKAAGFRFGLFDEWHDGQSGLVERVAKLIGLEPEAMPVKAKFIQAERDKVDKEKGKAAAAAKDKELHDAAKKAGKKSKSKKTKPAKEETNIEDLEEEDEL